jgi:hypothetical protein
MRPTCLNLSDRYLSKHFIYSGLPKLELSSINSRSSQRFLDFVGEQHNAADARDQLKAYMKKYVASKFSDGTANVAQDVEAMDPLAAMGFKGKAALPPAAGAASHSLAGTASPLGAAAATAAGAKSPRRAAAAAAASAGAASPRRAAAAASSSTPSTPQPPGVTAACPSGRRVSPSRIASAYRY